MAEPIDPDALEAEVRSGSWTSKELAKRLGRRHALVANALQADERFVSTRDGRRSVWGVLVEEPGAEEPEPLDEDEAGAVPAVLPEDLDGVIARVVDRDGVDAVARLRVIGDGRYLIADEVEDGGFGRVFDPVYVIEVIRAQPPAAA